MENQEYLNKFKNKAQNAKISPSENAWERLEFLLKKEKKHKKVVPLYWIGIAASICFVFSILYLQNTNQSIYNQDITKIDSIEIKENLKQKETKVEDLVTQTTIKNKIIEKNKNLILSENQIEKSEIITKKDDIKIFKNEIIKVDTPKIENQNSIAIQIQESSIQKQELTNEVQKTEQKVTEQQSNNKQFVESDKVKKQKNYVEQDVLLFSVENELHPIPENHSKKHIEFAKTLIHHLNSK